MRSITKNYNDTAYEQSVVFYRIDTTRGGSIIDKRVIHHDYISDINITQDITTPIPALVMTIGDAPDVNMHLYSDAGDSFIEFSMRKLTDSLPDVLDSTTASDLDKISVTFMIVNYSVVDTTKPRGYYINGLCTNWFDLNNYMNYATGSKPMKLVDAMVGMFNKAALNVRTNSTDVCNLTISNFINATNTTMYHSLMYLASQCVNTEYGPYYVSYDIHGDSNTYAVNNLKKQWEDAEAVPYNIFYVDGDESVTAQTANRFNIATNLKSVSTINANIKLEYTKQLQIKTFNHLTRTWDIKYYNSEEFANTMPPIPESKQSTNIRNIADLNIVSSDTAKHISVYPTNSKFQYHNRVISTYLYSSNVLFRTHGNLKRDIGDLIYFDFEDESTSLAQQFRGFWSIIKIERTFGTTEFIDVIYATRMYSPDHTQNSSTGLNNISNGGRNA